MRVPKTMINLSHRAGRPLIMFSQYFKSSKNQRYDGHYAYPTINITNSSSSSSLIASLSPS